MDNQNPLPMKYSIEIYEPKTVYTPWMVFYSESPFMAISKGDIINPGIWPNSESPQKVLRVLNVEHCIWKIEDKHITHKMLVFTEEVEGTQALRLEQ